MFKGQYIVYNSESVPLPFHLEKRLETRIVILNHGEWREHEMWDACSRIKEWKIEELRTNWNYHKTILKEISPIALPAIKSIVLQENCIESIEFVSRMHMPNLTAFWINKNLINKISILKKMHWPEIKDVAFHGNRLVDAKNFELLPGNMTQIVLEFEPANICGKKRLKEKKLYEKLKKRHVELEIQSEY